jgi:hypothetical protein
MKAIKLIIIAMLIAFGFNPPADAQTGNKVRHVVVVRSRRHHFVKHVAVHHNKQK